MTQVNVSKKNARSENGATSHDPKIVLTETRRRIVGKKQRLEVQLAEIQQEAGDEYDRAERASACNEILRAVKAFSKEIEQIDTALVRVADGSYGICEDCEEPIGSGRLTAKIDASLCIVCAEEKEREDKKYAPRQQSLRVVARGPSPKNDGDAQTKQAHKILAAASAAGVSTSKMTTSSC